MFVITKKEWSRKQSRYLFDPVALHSMLRHVIAGDHASNLMIRVHHNEVPEAHSAEEAVAPLDAAALIYAVWRAIHVRPNVQP